MTGKCAERGPVRISSLWDGRDSTGRRLGSDRTRQNHSTRNFGWALSSSGNTGTIRFSANISVVLTRSTPSRVTFDSPTMSSASFKASSTRCAASRNFSRSCVKLRTCDVRSKSRTRTVEDKLAIARETDESGATVSGVARRQVNANQAFAWRKLYPDGRLSAVSAGEQVVAASDLAEAMKQIRELQRLLGKNGMVASSSHD